MTCVIGRTKTIITTIKININATFYKEYLLLHHCSVDAIRLVSYQPIFHLQTAENELRKFEIQQANEQIKMLHSFMPESFLRRGGEKNTHQDDAKKECPMQE